jgi:light-regulated signal transduction histidine kinase (bacteriophytochrome)
LRWFGSCTDIHEQKQASDALRSSRGELQRANAALKRSNEDLERFAYAASHDLQEPLRMVVIYSQLLKEEYGSKLDSQALLYLHFAMDGALRMEALVRDLLSYSRTSAPVETPKSGVSAEEAIRKVFANMAASIQEAEAAIFVDPLPMVRIPEIHLVQIFQNLISNALKYRRHGIKADIRISAERCDGGWVFAVKDNGIGMAAQYQDQVFGVFRRLHGQDRPGTGIGLALCKSLVERHGGKVWVESVLGEGSTFFFTVTE